MNGTTSGLVGDVLSRYDYYLSLGDPRVQSWLLMDTPVATVSISLVYVILCNIVPKILKGRTIPVYYPVLMYNFGLVLLNLYMVTELILTTRGYNWRCQEVDYSNDEMPVRTAKVLWWFYFSKVIEMLDTVFFICKGNYRQLSFLHIYHHSTMFIIWWVGIKYVAGGNSVPPALLNSIIHVIMYSYYFFAAFGPRFKKYLWWKKYLTTFQLVQFVIDFVHGVIAYRDGCSFPHWMYYTMMGYMITFLILFGNFYVVNYVMQKPTEKQKKSD